MRNKIYKLNLIQRRKMPYIYRILRDRAHVERHVNYLKNGPPSLIKNSKIFLLFQELRRTRRWPDPEKNS